ncbi:MAG: DUF3108 domain-containing protein [Calditrichaceae bacterium]
MIYRSRKIILPYLVFIVLLLGNSIVYGQKFQWKVGEELVYKVKWSFIRLGTVKLQVVDTTKIDNVPVYHLRFFIDSNPLLFFVNNHSVYNSFFDENFRIQKTYSHEKIDNVNYRSEYLFDYADSIIRVIMTDIKDTSNTIHREMEMEKQLYDGIGMIFYARANAGKTKNDTLTSFFETQKGHVVINFKGKKEDIKVGVFDKPYQTYPLDGNINIKGIAGVTGPFEGWFATDGQRPPVKAKLKVFIGNVIVELEEWKNWDPGVTRKE